VCGGPPGGSLPSAAPRAPPPPRPQSLRQQLIGPARRLEAKRKAHLLYDTPMGGAGGSGAAALAGLPPPCFTPQPSCGPTSAAAAEAWARQQLAPGAPPLRALGRGGGGDGGWVPQGLPRLRLPQLMAGLGAPLTRALWILRAAALSQTRWGVRAGGASAAPAYVSVRLMSAPSRRNPAQPSAHPRALLQAAGLGWRRRGAAAQQAAGG
jgi:hypothetical protein